MNESISNAMVFSIVITIVAICTGIVFFSLGYSKAFKMKTKVIDIIEKDKGLTDAANGEIETYLKDSGYSSFASSKDVCPTRNDAAAINKLDNYFYCVYSTDTTRGTYYTVVLYTSLNVPLIGDIASIRYSIKGDSTVIMD